MLEISIKLLQKNSQPREKINKRAMHLTESHYSGASPVSLSFKTTNASHQNYMLKQCLPTISPADTCWLALYLELDSRVLKDRSSKGQHRSSSQRSDTHRLVLSYYTLGFWEEQDKWMTQTGLNTTQCSLYSEYVQSYQHLK